MKQNFHSSRGFAALGALIVVLVVAAIGGGAYYAKQRADVGANATSTAATEGKSSLRALVGAGQNVKCEFESEDGKSEGVVFIAGGKMRGDFETDVEGKGEVESHMIHDGEFAYVWSDAMAGQGVKMKTASAASAQVRQEGSLDWNAKVDYECDSWNPDADKFELPSGTAFIDLGSAMGGSASSSAAANANVNANLGVGAGGTATGSASAGLDVRSLLNY